MGGQGSGSGVGGSFMGWQLQRERGTFDGGRSEAERSHLRRQRQGEREECGWEADIWGEECREAERQRGREAERQREH